MTPYIPLLPAPTIIGIEDCPFCEGRAVVSLTFTRIARTCPTCRGARKIEVTLNTLRLEPTAHAS